MFLSKLNIVNTPFKMQMFTALSGIDGDKTLVFFNAMDSIASPTKMIYAVFLTLWKINKMSVTILNPEKIF